MSVCQDVFRDLGPLTDAASLVHLRVLATTDLHASLMPFDYFTDRPDDRIGLVRVGGLVEALREGIPNCLLFDNGDTFQGSMLAELAARGTSGFDSHPMIVAMNALGYDAATLGNHDFDYGIGMLDRILSQAAFPVVLANAQHPGNGEPFRPRHVILDREVEDLDGGRHSLRIGVTGTTPPQVGQWNRGVLDGGLSFEDAVEATAREARQLKAAGADIVVALAHSGLGDCMQSGVSPGDAGPSGNGAENVARAIAALQDVDAVVAGHTHEVFPTECDCDIFPPNAPIVQPGYWGSHLGCIDFALGKSRGGTGNDWSILRTHAEALPLDGENREAGRGALRRVLRRSGPALRRSVGRMHRSARSESRLRIGESVVALQTYFSTVAPCRATQLASDAQKAAASRAIAGVGGLGDLPVLSAISPMRSTLPDQYTDIPAGPILLRHVSDLYCYPNSLAVLRVRGQDLSDWLERSASIYHRIDPDDPSWQPLIDHRFAGYNFDRIDGLLYDIDVSRPARTDARGDRIFDTPGRIRNLRHADGRPVDPEEETLVVTNSYRAAGGGSFPACARTETVFDDTVLVRDHIVDFIRAHCGPIRPEPSASFRLCGFGRARPVVETGAGAMHHADQLPSLGLVPLGPGTEISGPPCATGTLRFELRHRDGAVCISA
jgi:2',3'-cyclic-nucleotide 2'-phosphodiesterase/3'-nucleotidase